MTFFSLDPSFDFIVYAMQVCLHIFFFLPKLYISPLEVGKKEDNAIICLGEGSYTIERFESTI
jgi:hypothetical protein